MEVGGRRKGRWGGSGRLLINAAPGRKMKDVKNERRKKKSRKSETTALENGLRQGDLAATRFRGPAAAPGPGTESS